MKRPWAGAAMRCGRVSGVSWVLVSVDQCSTCTVISQAIVGQPVLSDCPSRRNLGRDVAQKYFAVPSNLFVCLALVAFFGAATTFRSTTYSDPRRGRHTQLYSQ